jgi:hypothetical protein
VETRLFVIGSLDATVYNWAPDRDVQLVGLWAVGRLFLTLDPSQTFNSPGKDKSFYYQSAAASLVSGWIPLDFTLRAGSKIFADTGGSAGNSVLMLSYVYLDDSPSLS